MDTRTVKLVSSLIRHDRDMAEAYERAYGACQILDNRVKLDEFKADHEAHALRLTQHLLDAGRAVVWDDVDVFIDELDRPMATDSEALAALQHDEELSNRAYDNILARDLPDAVRSTVERGREDERRHLAWIEGAIGRERAA